MLNELLVPEPELQSLLGARDRPAETATRIVIVIVPSRGLIWGLVVVLPTVCIQTRRPHMEVSLTVIGSAAAPANTVDHDRPFAVVGAEVGSLHFHFLRHVAEDRLNSPAIATWIDDVDTVIGDARAASAGCAVGFQSVAHQAALGANDVAPVNAGTRAQTGVGRYAGKNLHQHGDVAGGENQFVDVLGRQHRRTLAGVDRLHFVRRRFHRNRLGGFSNLQLDVGNGSQVARVDRDFGVLPGLEALRLHGHGINPWDHTHKGEIPDLVACGLADVTARLIEQNNFGFWNYRPGLVIGGSGEGPGGLRLGERREQERSQHR